MTYNQKNRIGHLWRMGSDGWTSWLNVPAISHQPGPGPPWRGALLSDARPGKAASSFAVPGCQRNNGGDSAKDHASQRATALDSSHQRMWEAGSMIIIITVLVIILVICYRQCETNHSHDCHHCPYHYHPHWQRNDHQVFVFELITYDQGPVNHEIVSLPSIILVLHQWFERFPQETLHFTLSKKALAVV